VRPVPAGPLVAHLDGAPVKGYCDICHEPMHGNRKHDCRDCRERQAEWDAMTPEDRRAEWESIETYYREIDAEREAEGGAR
jgi:hypothetical protein